MSNGQTDSRQSRLTQPGNVVVDYSELEERRVQNPIVPVEHPAPDDAAYDGRHCPGQQDRDPKNPGPGERLVEKQRCEQSKNHHRRHGHSHECRRRYQRRSQVVAV